MKPKKILLFMGSYLPGTKSAGVITSVSNMCKYLKGEVEFYILTEDRDIGDTGPYKNVELEQWTRYGEANVYYSHKYIKSLRELRAIMKSQDFDAYYINGFYNISDNLRPMMLYLMRQVPRVPIVIAPRGIFSLGEYENKKFLRAIYRRLYKISGLNRRVKWHSTSEMERRQILEHFPKADVDILPNLTDIEISDGEPRIVKEAGRIKILFISRISEKKNIKFLLDRLTTVNGEIDMDFYGMIGTDADKRYWAECEDIIGSLPANIKCNYCGVVGKDRIKEVYQSYHLFFFPTFGENFGHVIAESLAFGCPVLLSDQTPWNMLDEYGAGFNIPLSEPERYTQCLQEMIDMDGEKWAEMSHNAIRLANDYLNRDKIVKDYIEFFKSL